MPFEVPVDERAARRVTIWRWVSLGIVALLIVLLVYIAVIGFLGSGQLVEPADPSADCRTPAIAYSWTYEAINYDASTDAELADLPDPENCPEQGAPAGNRVTSSDGVRLAGWYIPAGNGMNSNGPTIVLAHDYGGNKSTMLATAEVLHVDYNLVLFDFRNHGQSGSAATTAGVYERGDLRAIVDWLESTKHPVSIGVLGLGMGGAAAAAEAIGDIRVVAVVLDSTHATLANAIQARLDRDGFPLGLPGAWSVLMGGLIRTGQDMSAVDPLQSLARYGERPLLIIAAGQDDAVGSNDAQDLLQAAQEDGADAELQTCPAAGHGRSVEACADDYASWVLGFFGRSMTASR